MSKRVLRGTVVSDKNKKTRVVVVKRRLAHPLLKKISSKKKRYHVHDEDNVTKVGDSVLIIECRPMSRLKRWSVFSKKEKEGERLGEGIEE